MDEHDLLAERFETHRARLRAIAYQTLGSASDADDAVQEAWLRLGRTDSGSIDNLGGWLTTVVARVCLNMLQSHREEPAGPRRAGCCLRLPGPPRTPSRAVRRPPGGERCPAPSRSQQASRQ
jgi:DNA-directed RNA polymerase specialized sigma24 family protein